MIQRPWIPIALRPASGAPRFSPAALLLRARDVVFNAAPPRAWNWRDW